MKMREYFSFTTPEAKHAIDEYLDYRERFGERLTPNSPLFREQFDINDQFEISRPKPLAMSAFEFIFENALLKQEYVRENMRQKRRKIGEQQEKKSHVSMAFA